MKLLQLCLLIASGIAAAHAACPTITAQQFCPTCPVLECLAISTITAPCGCPTTVPTSVVTHACGTPCSANGCGGTQWVTAIQTCPPSGCPTITSTVRAPDCTPPPFPGGDFCAEEACLLLKEVPVPCSCKTVATTTVTGPCTCRSGCGTYSTPMPTGCPSTMTTMKPTCGA